MNPSVSSGKTTDVTGTSAPTIDPVDGLTNDEGAVLDSLAEAYEAYTSLPVQHQDEPGEFTYHIHMLQGLLACRIARRHYPKGWTNAVQDPQSD